jgi:hypothetical protein
VSVLSAQPSVLSGDDDINTRVEVMVLLMSPGFPTSHERSPEDLHVVTKLLHCSERN